MQEYMRVCPICEKEKDRSIFQSKLYVPGWFNFWNCEPPEDLTCDTHKEQKLLKMQITCEEFKTLRYISNEPSFMRAMEELKTKDIIEYNLKVAQFRTQVEQQQESNIPHCPHCKSTNIKSISGLNRGASIAMWGIFSKKINKSFECLDCRYTW